MTAIAALVEDGVVYMGGDSAGVAGFSITIRKDPKVFINKEFIIGFTSSFRMGQLLKESFVPPAHPKKMGTYKYMVTLFIDEVKRCFSDGGFATPQKGGTFLVGYRGKLYLIDSDYQVGIPASNYDAVGCGGEICIGSLYSSQKMDLKPKERIRLALKAAEEHNGGVRSPFIIKSV